MHNLPQCQERLSPCSTFKIPNALIGLDSGVLTGPGDIKKWDGTVHSRKILNQDHDLSSAILYSVVWYFQDAANDIGPERTQSYLDAFDYGNRDISGGQDNFWLASSLKISALEQIRFMNALEENALPAEKEHQLTVKSMMLQDDKPPEGFTGEVHGKTGTCVSPEYNHAWFTGFYYRDDEKYVFTVNVKEEGARGGDARAIALDVLQAVR